MGICVSHEPHHVELPNRAKNCSLLYRPIETSPYANIHRKSTISGKTTHLTVPHPKSIDRQEHLDHLHIDKDTKDMLKLDFIDEHVWKSSNPYCKLFQQDSQGKYITEELINYELNSLKVQMAKSQAIIAALSSPTTELTENYGMPRIWVPENANYHNSLKESQNIPISTIESQVHIFANEIISNPAPTKINKATANGLPSFLLPHSQTQSFDQNPDHVNETQSSRKNNSHSCPNLSSILQTFSPNRFSIKNPQTKSEYNSDFVPDENETNRNRSCSYLAAIQHGNATLSTPPPPIEEELSPTNIRKLSTLNEDDLEIVSTNAAKTSLSEENKRNSPEPPPYRHPPPTASQTKLNYDMDNDNKIIEVENENQINSDSPKEIEAEAMQSQSETRSKSAVCVSDIAFQRRAGFSFRRRPGQKGTSAAVVNALPTIRRSSAIELLDDTSPSEQHSLNFGKQKTCQQHLHSSSHGHQQLSVEMENSETESAKGSIESEYDVPAALGGFTVGQSPVPAEDPIRKSPDCEDFVEKLIKFNACHPGLLRLESLSEVEVESEFQNLCLVFNNSKITVKKRLETHQRQRDLAETNVTKELEQLKTMMKSAIAVSQNGNSQQKKQMATNLQQQLDVIQQVIQRLSGRAEIYGATEQEEKMCKAAEVMMQYVCNIKNKETKLQKELEETKRIMDRTAAMGLGNHAKAILSHRDSMSSMTSPNLGRRRASLCLSSASSAMVSAQVLPLTCTCRQSMEEGDQLLKTKLRCPLHCGSSNSKRRSISVFTPPIPSLLNEFKRIHSNNSSNSSSNHSNEKAANEDQVRRSPLHTPIDDIIDEEKLWTAASNSNDQLQTLTINELVDEERDDSDSCIDDDFLTKAEDEHIEYNSSDEGPDEYFFSRSYENSSPKSKENSWLDLISLLKSIKTKKKSDSFRDILCWWKKSGDAVQLIRYVIGGFLIMLAVGFLLFSFIRPADHVQR